MAPLLDLARFIVDVDDDTAAVLPRRAGQRKYLDIILRHSTRDLQADIRTVRPLLERDTVDDVGITLIGLIHALGYLRIGQCDKNIFAGLIDIKLRRNLFTNIQDGSEKWCIGIITGRRADTGNFRFCGSLRRKHREQADSQQNRYE